MKKNQKQFAVSIAPFGVVIIDPASKPIRDRSGTVYAIHSDGSYRRVTPKFTDLKKRKRRHFRTIRRCISAKVRGEFYLSKVN